MQLNRAIRKFWSILNKETRMMGVMLASLMVLASLMEMVGLSTIPVFLSSLTEGSGETANPIFRTAKNWFNIETQRAFLTMAALILGIVFTFQTALLTGLAFFKARYTSGIIRYLSNLLFQGYLRAPLAFHSERHSSLATNQIVLETMRTANEFVYPILHTIQSLSLTVAILTFVVIMSPAPAMAVFFGVALLAVGLMLVMRRRARAYGETLTRQNAKLTEDVTETVGCLKHIRLRGLEPRFEEAFARDSGARADAIGFQRFANQFPKPMLEGMTVLGMVIMVFAVMDHSTSVSGVIPSLGLIGAAVARVLPHVNQCTTWMLKIYQHASSAQALADDVANLKRMGVYEPYAEPIHIPAEGLVNRSIKFEHVSFRYPNAKSNSLEDVTFEIPSKSSVAFVGPTGAGKSTIVDLICGLVVPNAGSIWIDDRTIGNAYKALQRRVGYIPQNIFIANRSVRENVAVGLNRDEIDDSRVWEVLRQAQIEGFVAELPNGLDTPCGESGVRLSGGQRQRLGIARALYHDPEILVLDEATAALDNETERRLMNAINQVRTNRTLIMIAHRLSSIRDCDRIFVMEDGRITGQGTYDELMQSHQGFRAMAA